MTEAASVYGEALYVLAKDENKSDVMLMQLKALDESFTQEPDFLRLLSAPNLSKIERKEILDTCCTPSSAVTSTRSREGFFASSADSCSPAAAEVRVYFGIRVLDR